LPVAPGLDDYLLAIIEATRHTKGSALGASPRGAIALRRTAQARAFLNGRDHATPDDVKALAVPVLAHRVMLEGGAIGNIQLASEQMILRLLQNITVPL
jgi:MoxR-like ATPase